MHACMHVSVGDRLAVPQGGQADGPVNGRAGACSVTFALTTVQTGLPLQFLASKHQRCGGEGAALGMIVVVVHN
jgi:hypothetical protein